jgi:hypothetical protein
MENGKDPERNVDWEEEWRQEKEREGTQLRKNWNHRLTSLDLRTRATNHVADLIRDARKGGSEGRRRNL